ncbi:cytochrome-c peroxidase [Ulvibacterium sp.]|uniref:cytochrome-c peroxidase n=1 Tax=Ulvibacterium sp. TaxID=2665914 RepID=UPI003BACF732
MKKSKVFIIAVFLLAVAFEHLSLDDRLRQVIDEYKLKAYVEVPKIDSSKVQLGRMLFFDKVLSGNHDVSCATCHHPSLKSGDNLQLAIGVGGYGLGRNRIMGEGRDRVPRNSPEIFNRGSEEWHTMFWDGRVSGIAETGFLSPADEKLPYGLDNVLAAQAMFPVTSRDEMRGEIGDVDIFGGQNELSLISNAAPQSVWQALMRRILSFPGYRKLFRDAYPETPLEKLGFQHAANAIAAFEIKEFTFIDSPWDKYLRGDLNALDDSAKRGALLFYGKANCAECHSGNLLTDQEFHNIGIPQFGPGKDNAAPLDAGRFAETGNPNDRFAFRTPPLRNVAITGPWMHNGAYGSLEEAIRHHLDPKTALERYDVNQLSEELRTTYKGDSSVIERVLENLDPLVKNPINLTSQDVKDVLAFMESLTDPSANDLSGLIPKEVPSKLPIEEIDANSDYSSH